MKDSTTISNEKHLLTSLKSGDEKSFNLLYHTYAKKLLEFSYSFTKNKISSEEIVQDIFESIWKKREDLNIDGSFQHYIFGIAKHKILNYFRSEKVRKKYVDHFNLFLAQYDITPSVQDFINLQDLKTIIHEELEMLPNKCKEAFMRSRFDHKSLDEIADIMGISKRTVENYITQALKHLRIKLKDYYWIVILFFI
ncbi:RNA polymerase sigma factor [Sphingobacterium bovistauri]|uniref:RNA polymerase sigma-70 factor n=1 Tax=Sphingobacterium bovistauri TaxID=2781959 RepID=A0ABS7Z5V3_9SPHI|nr:RNA polymerase sigma-70 factor [Sphingobacterium bovistauri]MCA5004314.1 RNA polymerase sigma-70 factor [Sphingobacterium bovistauri]